jgi:hypothetical protein
VSYQPACSRPFHHNGLFAGVYAAARPTVLQTEHLKTRLPRLKPELCSQRPFLLRPSWLRRTGRAAYSNTSAPFTPIDAHPPLLRFVRKNICLATITKRLHGMWPAALGAVRNKSGRGRTFQGIASGPATFSLAIPRDAAAAS